MWASPVRKAGVLGLILFFLVGCGRWGSDPDTLAIEGLLAQRVQAINSKDLELYESLIAEEYLDDGVTRAQLVERMAGYFTRFHSIRLDYSDTEIDHARGRARVSQRIRLQVSGLREPMLDTEAPSLKSWRSPWSSEALLLEKSNGRWAITGGL